jgi:DNA-binding transcriptional MocR family regulator
MRRDVRRQLEQTGIEFPMADEGAGIFLWGRVPERTPVDELVRDARDHSILLAKGALFSPSRGCGQWLRFNVAHSAAPPLIRFLESALG